MIGISRNCLTRPADQRLVLVEDFRRRKTPADRRDLLDALLADGEASLEWPGGLCRLGMLGIEVHAETVEHALRRWCIAASQRAA
ncbi:hypothetical protein FDP22_12485 [Paroceanicella profunda]|uniref:Uncharacterized protein n=1 Tax=Paroceanicella profunda TaxID=2579971 RepID=A0A5B8FVR1_9RHOB|nr:hypothetical protein [Paroceanicella profunda]QDL92525.1 hypothetical protein FDP22_12485 [Paroceanicella profunda]